MTTAVVETTAAAPRRAVCNVALHLARVAREAPTRVAVVEQDDLLGRSRSLTFEALDRRCDAMARGLARAGVARGTRALLVAPLGVEFFPLVFALFRIGAVIVLADPGMGRKRWLGCVEESAPEALIGVRRAHLARRLFPKAFRSVKVAVQVGSASPLFGTPLDALAVASDAPFEMAATRSEEEAAILFTSGSTGAPKGAVYTHGIFEAQLAMLRETYGIRPGDVDLPTFPLFALFDPALGVTAVLPRMDFRRPGAANPKRIVDALVKHRCTSMFASPALLDAVSRYAASRELKLTGLRRVVSAGAPVRTDILARASAMLDGDGEVFTPYGATEALPVTNVSAREVLLSDAAATGRGAGVCVGHPVRGATVRVVRITDEAIAAWSDELLEPAGTIGEVTVAGPVVTARYIGRPELTRLAKIADGERVVHRMGDLGYFDDAGRLWIVGRKSQRVLTEDGPLYPVACEEIFNQHAGVRRTALVGVGARGRQTPVIVVERDPDARGASAALKGELRGIAAEHAMTRGITEFLVYPRPLPVDARHNAKIEREALARWAAERLGAS